MVNKTTLISLGLGVVAMTVFVALIVLVQRGASPRLEGQITAVRTLGMDASSSVAIVDFHVTNTSQHRMVIGSIEMSVVDSKGETKPGQVIAASDLHRLFDLFPAMGNKSGEPLIIKTKMASKASFTGMVAARFDLSKSDLDARKKITLSVADVDGPVSEISK